MSDDKGLRSVIPQHQATYGGKSQGNFPPEEEKIPNPPNHRNIPVYAHQGNIPIGNIPVDNHYSLDISKDDSFQDGNPMKQSESLFIKSFDENIKAGPNDNPDASLPHTIGQSFNLGGLHQSSFQPITAPVLSNQAKQTTPAGDVKFGT